MAINVIVVEDDSRLRSGLKEIIDNDPECDCVGAFGSGEEALEKAPPLSPQVAVMDINLPGMDGIECVRQLAERLPSLQIVMLTVYQDTDNLFRALAAERTAIWSSRRGRAICWPRSATFTGVARR